jgi:hypothetical protein
MGLFCRIAFSGPATAPFHAKHSCAKTASRPVARACDVSRETVFSDSAPLTHPARAAMFHVKHFCVFPPRELSHRTRSLIFPPCPNPEDRIVNVSRP